MAKALVIVESPAKAKTINKFLGSQYTVKSSIGHIRDLPVSGTGRTAARTSTKGLTAEQKKQLAKEKLFNRIGVNPEADWQAHYEILPGKEKVVSELKKLAKNASTIYLATDLDREGEAIAWHLKETLGGDESKYQRVVFNQITKKAIAEAFENPTQLDMHQVEAQQARRFLDRVVGFMVSPLLWSKVARGLSAGRVQSVAVRLIVEREREIRAFVPEEFWTVNALLKHLEKGELNCEVSKQAGKNFRPNTKEATDAALALLEKATYQVTKREDKPTQSRPSAPYITSTLQQAASTRLGFSVKKTMTLAQRLYEAGHITYMRTDSTHLAPDAIADARNYIEEHLGKDYLPEKPNFYSSREGAQEAHEAIRPTSASLISTKLTAMERDAQRLYELIWRQFIACQMLPARYLSTSLVLSAGEFELRARGRVMQFDGYTRIQPVAGKQGEDQLLPNLQEGELLDLNKLLPAQHFTKPPARFTEAALVRELEKRSIGRPSTYAAIISTIQERGYVKLDKRRFFAEKMGDVVTDRLVESFADLLDYNFTARMEESLDEVAEGEQEWKQLLNKFYAGFTQQLEAAEAKEGGMRPNQPVETSIPCPTCSRNMQIRIASTGTFLGCSGYALPPKERCKTTLNLVPGEEFVAADADDELAETNALRAKKRCAQCGTAMEAFIIDEQRKLHICGNSPDCEGYEIETGKFKLKGYEGPSLECDKCGNEMQLKTGRFGKYFGCTNTECKNTRKLLKNGEAAPPKMNPVPMPDLKCIKVDDHYVLRDGASGVFLSASQFPKNRETRTPLLQEILPYKESIDPKYSYLFDGPVTDTEGNPTAIRYSRKNKEQYLQAEKEGKATGFRAYYRNNQWVIEDKSKK